MYAKRANSSGEQHGREYLLDHSVFLYLIDGENEFIEVYGRDKDEQESAADIIAKINRT